ncbi:MAG: tRNA (adenosine(37)-N6)-threonylcarbamoyltransferase complex ATPase subunit type 1 TsaE [Burkholderiales bacterium]|nr:tRNA (adenosine(37)-N6)-threonylcarbamoyltransferase complex ATPase subunit type 1 TsaE [Burkholderiales bacterium]
MSSAHLTVALADAAATEALGAALAPLLVPGMRIHLSGDLGAGKTTLARGLLRALGHPGAVRSPTYNLVEIYVFSGYILYHFDFYRFKDPSEFDDAGFADYFNADTVCLVEWPEMAAGALPGADLDVTLSLLAGDARSARLEALSDRGEQCLNALRRKVTATRSP